jgi:hypothetical protein
VKIITMSRKTQVIIVKQSILAPSPPSATEGMRKSGQSPLLLSPQAEVPILKAYSEGILTYGLKLVRYKQTYSQGGVQFPTGGIPAYSGEPASALSLREGGQQIW